MDSGPSSSPLAARDGPLAARDGPPASAEDDYALSVATGLAKEAFLLLQAMKFEDCLRILNQLLLKNENDPKILHNIAIVESIRDGCADPKRLIEALENIQKQCEEPTHASGKHLEVTGNDGRKPMGGMKRTYNAAHHFSGSSIYSDEFDTSVAMFNLAVIRFHLHDYEQSFLYLDTLYQNIEYIDEGTAFRIRLLFLDVALLSHHASRSADALSYMEKVFCASSLIGQVENGASTQQRSSLVLKSTSLSTGSTTTNYSHSDSVVGANMSENSLSRTLSEEALEDESLQMLSSLDIGGRNLQRLSGITPSNDILRSQSEDSLSVVDLRLKLHLYKVRFLVLSRNLQAAKREVKMAMNLARGKDYNLALYLKSQLEYARRNPHKAIKLLMASDNRMEPGISTMYYNNLGCIYYHLGKHHTSGVFFSKALKSSLLGRKEKPPKLLTLSQDKSLMISYNCGMYSLACGRPFNAARCFKKSSIIFYNRPLVWLRIAECCLMALEKGLITFDSPPSEGTDIKVSVIGRGKWRHLALISESSSKGQSEYVIEDDGTIIEVSVIGKGKWRHLALSSESPSKGQLENTREDEGEWPELSIFLARYCLVKALSLLESTEAKQKNSSFGSPPGTEENELSEMMFTNQKNPGSGDPKEPLSQLNSNGELKEKSGNINNHSALLQNSITHYEEICKKENHMMKQALLADLAYVELALENPLVALTTAKSLLELPECSRTYIFLGTMYVAESLCLLNRPDEASEHLMKYISSGNVELPYTKEDCEKWKTEKVADNDDSKASHVVSSSDESQVSSMFSSPEEARGVLFANFAAFLALTGDFEQSRHFVTKALSDIPKCSQAILTAIYLDLKQGKIEEAIAKLKQHSATRFLPGSFKLNGAS